MWQAIYVWEHRRAPQRPVAVRVPRVELDRVSPADAPSLEGRDPVRLVVGGEAMESQARAIIEGFANRPHIFNLGHGITPRTPIDSVDALVDEVLTYSRSRA